jgi:CubicO group peptidase (beta-lactamase class C family)
MRLIALIVVTLLAISCEKNNNDSLVTEDSDLSIGKAVKSTLGAEGADTFRLNLQKDAFVTGFANQFNVDVVITILGPGNEKVGAYDESARGRDLFQFTSNESGIHKLVITPFEKGSGNYAIQIRNVESQATEPGKRIDQLVNAMIGEDGPGASIAVWEDGKTVFSKGYGHANIEYDIHNTPQTIFHVASVSKQFTAFAIAMLADQGKIALDDDIRKYIPEIHDFGTPITIRHLVHNTSGLRDQWNLLAMAGWRLDDVITRDHIMKVVGNQRALNFKPGEQHNYCNTGYTLMAEIVSRVTGTPFPRWTKENIFNPLGMSSTLFYDDHEKVVPNRAYSYQVSDTTFKKSVLSYANVGATSLFTTAEDLLKWADNFNSMKVGNADVMKIMEQRFVLTNGDTIDYAFGQVVNKFKGLKSIGHSGGDAGYRSFLLRFPEEDLNIAVLSNLASFGTHALSYQIAELYLAGKLKEDKKKEAAPPAQAPAQPSFDVASVNLRDYQGTFYSDELKTYYEFEVKNDTLIAHHPRHSDFAMRAVKKDGFRADAWWMGNIDFTRDGSGRIRGMKANNGRVTNLEFVKE